MTSDKDLLGKLLSSVTAVTACVAGFLYLAGMATLWVRMVKAGRNALAPSSG
jgi:hypothetical protein